MIEILTAVSLAGKAFNALKRGVQAHKDLSEMTGYFSAFYDNKDKITEASIELENTSFLSKQLSKKSIETQALELAIAKQKTAEYELALREIMVWSGQAETYQEMMRLRRVLRQQRLDRARAKAKRKKDLVDLSLAIIILSVSIVSIIWIMKIIVTSK
tara:strand:+ start:454 stop:927 length:474 start_codon:yes stop_codon:yes gene_type:complete